MTGFRILADENIPGLDKVLPGANCIERMPGRDIDAGSLSQIDILLVRSVTQVNEALLAGTPVRFVGTATSGLDHVDQDYLQSAGIAFSAAPGANAQAVVDYVFAAIASCDDHLERLMAGGRVGIVGAGQVGSLLARRLRDLGVACLMYDPWVNRDALLNPASLTDVLDCQVVSLHPELTRRDPYPSWHLLDDDRLREMRADQLLVNASRGGIVDGQALLWRLSNAEAPGCVLDVWEGEPGIDANLHLLCRWGTPHIAGYSIDAKHGATAMLHKSLSEFLSTEPWSVDRELPPYELQLKGQHGGLAGLRRVLLNVCDIQHDHRQLIEVLRSREPEQGFDSLRRNYRDRRELPSTRISGVDDTELMGWLTALGAEVVS